MFDHTQIRELDSAEIAAVSGADKDDQYAAGFAVGVALVFGGAMLLVALAAL